MKILGRVVIKFTFTFIFRCQSKSKNTSFLQFGKKNVPFSDIENIFPTISQNSRVGVVLLG